jgi:1-deoxy-D-xylulose-5-phosphate synthase
MNNAAAAGNHLVVILNDNDMSIAPPVGSLRNALARLVSSGKYLAPRKLAQKLARAMPEPLHVAARRMEEFARGMLAGGTLFDELVFYYVGPVDGHDVRALVEVLENVRDADIGPMLVHVVTKKGKGYAPAVSTNIRVSSTFFRQCRPKRQQAPRATSVYASADCRDGARRGVVALRRQYRRAPASTGRG